MEYYLTLYLLPLLAGLSLIIIWRVFFVLIPSVRQHQQPYSPLIWGREKQIYMLADRIRTGQSSAIISFFSEERTFILGYLRNEDPEQRQMLYADTTEKLIFSYIDITFLTQECSPSQFWEIALKPLRKRITQDSELDEAYQEAKNNQFRGLNLETLFGLIGEKGWRLVLILDRFEELSQHGLGKDWEFISRFRVAASRTPSPLVLITASCLSLKQIHQKIQANPSTSPVLYFLEGGVIYLSNRLSKVEMDQFWAQNDLSFSPEIRQAIEKMVGGHPYLLKLAMIELKKVSLDGEHNSFETIENAFYEQVKHIIANAIKRSWSSRMCQAYLAIVQQHEIPEDFENELQQLEAQGIIVKHHNTWQNTIAIVARFMIDKDNLSLCQNQTIES